MELKAIHQDEARRRALFPVATRQAFLGNAAVCPLPLPVSRAMSDYALAASLGDQEKMLDLPRLLSQTKERAGRLLGVAGVDISLVGPTSMGLSMVAAGLAWRKGDNVVYYHSDYPSNAVVWMNLERQGVEARPVRTEIPGVITRELLEPLVDGNTRLVALASAHFVSGYRIDVEGIGRWLREKGVLFCLDAIQTTGAVRVPGQWVDFLAADSHKWMLGPCGTGIFYVRPQVRQQLEPVLLGWNNVICPDFLTPEKVSLYDSGRRYEAGTPGIVGISGLHAALGLLEGWGFDAVEAKILDHTRYIRGRVREAGWSLGSPSDEPGTLAGISSFRREGVDLEAAHQRLTEAGVVASFRATPNPDGSKTRWIRFSPHAYNTRAEIDRALDILLEG